MSLEQATIILANELKERIGARVVFESAYKIKLIQEALSAFPVGNPFSTRLPLMDLNSFISTKLFRNKSSDITELKPYFIRDLPYGSNYFFMEHSYSDGTVEEFSIQIVTPFALIGREEVKELRRLFYKEKPPLKVYLAMEELGIKDFFDIYKLYSEKEEEFSLLAKLCNSIDYFIHFCSSLDYDKDNEVIRDVFNEDFGSIKDINLALKFLGLRQISFSKGYTKLFIPKSEIEKFLFELKDPLSYKTYFNEFTRFVFSLPSDEQNIESNKLIISSSQDKFLLRDIFLKEYSKGDHFIEYFQCLNPELKSDIVKVLKLVTERRYDIDLFLGEEGFRNVGIDFLYLYKNNPSKFIEYFQDKKLEENEKKLVLRKILSSNEENFEIIKWLEENESSLLREVGLNG